MAPETVTIADNAAIITRQRHIVDIPPLCSRTHNPLAGSSVELSYVPAANRVLEVYSLTNYIHGFYGNEIVRDIEQFALVVAQECADALGVQIETAVTFVLNIGQSVTTWVTAMPGEKG